MKAVRHNPVTAGVIHQNENSGMLFSASTLGLFIDRPTKTSPWLIAFGVLASIVAGCGEPAPSPVIAVAGGSPIKLFDVTVAYGGNLFPFGVIGEFGADMAFGPPPKDNQLLVRWQEEGPDNPIDELDFTSVLSDVDMSVVREIQFQHHGNGRWSCSLIASDTSVIATTEKMRESKSGE